MKNGLFLFIASILVPATTMADLISVEDLKKELANPKLVILDVRKGETPGAEFAKGHVPNAQLVPFSEVAVTVGDLEVEMPDPKKFEAYMQKVGVNNDSKIVIVGDGKTANSFAAAPRLYWTLKNFGAKDVDLLNGGVETWFKAGEKTALGDPAPVATIGNFTVVESTPYPHLATKEDVNRALAENRDVIDARPMATYNGYAMKKGWKQKGHIDGAKMAYYGLMFKENTTEFLSKEELAKYFIGHKIDLDEDTVVYCGDGYGSMNAWFAISEIIGKPTKMYDGGMFEWDGLVSTIIQN